MDVSVIIRASFGGRNDQAAADATAFKEKCRELERHAKEELEKLATARIEEKDNELTEIHIAARRTGTPSDFAILKRTIEKEKEEMEMKVREFKKKILSKPHGRRDRSPSPGPSKGLKKRR